MPARSGCALKSNTGRGNCENTTQSAAMVLERSGTGMSDESRKMRMLTADPRVTPNERKLMLSMADAIEGFDKLTEAFKCAAQERDTARRWARVWKRLAKQKNRQGMV